MDTFFIINIKESKKEEVTFFLELLYDKNIVNNKFDNYYHYNSHFLAILNHHLYKFDDMTLNYMEESDDYKEYKKVHFNNINHFLRYLKINKIRKNHG